MGRSPAAVGGPTGWGVRAKRGTALQRARARVYVWGRCGGQAPPPSAQRAGAARSRLCAACARRQDRARSVDRWEGRPIPCSSSRRRLAQPWRLELPIPISGGAFPTPSLSTLLVSPDRASAVCSCARRRASMAVAFAEFSSAAVLKESVRPSRCTGILGAVHRRLGGCSSDSFLRRQPLMVPACLDSHRRSGLSAPQALARACDQRICQPPCMPCLPLAQRQDSPWSSPGPRSGSGCPSGSTAPRSTRRTAQTTRAPVSRPERLGGCAMRVALSWVRRLQRPGIADRRVACRASCVGSDRSPRSDVSLVLASVILLATCRHADAQVGQHDGTRSGGDDGAAAFRDSSCVAGLPASCGRPSLGRAWR